jgi:hypothetical protein
MLKQVIVGTTNERTTMEADAKESSCQKEQVRIISSRFYCQLYIYIYIYIFLEILKYLN